MWKVWRVPPNSPCSPLLSPQHRAAPCSAAADPTADCPILVKSGVCSSPMWRWPTIYWWSLFLRSCKDSAPRKISPFPKFRVNLYAVPYALLDFINLLTCQCKYLSGWWALRLFQLSEILPCCCWRPILCNAPFIVHLPQGQHVTVKSISQAPPCEPFLSQTWGGYRYPKCPKQAGQPRRRAWRGVLWARKHPGFQGSKPTSLPVNYS